MWGLLPRLDGAVVRESAVVATMTFVRAVFEVPAAR
jgi:hypothetical protein